MSWSATALGQMCPRLKGSARSPRMDTISSLGTTSIARPQMASHRLQASVSGSVVMSLASSLYRSELYSRRRRGYGDGRAARPRPGGRIHELVTTRMLTSADAADWRLMRPDSRTSAFEAIDVIVPARDRGPDADRRPHPPPDRPASDDAREPRFQVRRFRAERAGVRRPDVDGLRARPRRSSSTASVFGYPLESIAEIPPGEYTCRRCCTATKLFTAPTGIRSSCPWIAAKGNTGTAPREISTARRKRSASIRPPKGMLDSLSIKSSRLFRAAADTKYIKHVKIESKLLTEFWGRPMYLGAHVLLPEGFDEHPEARYPLVIFHGHFPCDFGGFRDDPPDPDLEPIQCTLRPRWLQPHPAGTCLRLLQTVDGPDFPRLLIIEIQHANPYYDDSYAVNSANLGPYGDAITYELIPYIEETFRASAKAGPASSTADRPAVGRRWASRSSIPTSTTAASPPVPTPSTFAPTCWSTSTRTRTPTSLRGPFETNRDAGTPGLSGRCHRAPCATTNHRELVLGTKTRSGEQWDIWQAGLLAGREMTATRSRSGTNSRGDRPRGGRVLAGELRPALHPGARLGDARTQARGQDPHLLPATWTTTTSTTPST